MKNTFKRILTLALVVMMLIGCIPTGVFAEEAVALPSATISSIEEPGYTYAFGVNVPEPTFDQNVAYAGWEADFELTFNKDIKLNADRSANGFVAIRNGTIGMGAMSSAPATDVILEAGQSLKILDYINLMNGGTSDKPNFLQVFTYWKDFQFGIFLDQKYLEANPDFNATLELKLYNPENGEATVLASQVVGKAELPTATITKVENKNLTFAMKFVADDATAHQLSYYGNWYADFEISFSKKVTFNANGGKDGYLSGEYGEWGWINAPIEDVTLNANEVLKVMEYAAEMKGEPGLKYTYKEVVEVVKEFNCGVFFEPAFLAANPDIIATVVLKIYNPANEEENYQIGNTFTFGVPELPTATTNGLEKDELTFGMEFKADTPTAEQLAYYGKWFADFEITVNKDVVLDANGTGDGYLSGQYDGEWVDEDWAWRGEWVNVPFNEVVTLEANKPLKIMAFAAESLNEPGLKYTYKEAVEVVKNFKCGAYFTPEFLQANPDLRVTLELRIYNPADENVNYLIGETYVFDNSFVAYNVETNKHYKTVSAALNEAVAGQTVRLIKNATDMLTTVLDGITLDLNGYKLETQYVFATGNIVDDSTSNNGRIKAELKMVLSENNRQLPVRDANGEVAFYEVLKVVHAIAEKTETSVKYAFQTKFEAAAHEALLAGQATTGVKIVVRATWTRVDGTIGVQDFVYNDSWTEMFINSYVASSGKYGKMFTLVLDGYQNYENLQYQAYVISDYTSSFTVDKATTQEVNLTNEEGATAVVPSGAILSGSEKNLALKVTELDNSASNIVLEKNEVQKSVDVHVAGISENNTVPVIVTVKGFAEAGLNDGNLKLYHVEKGKTNLMTQVSSLSEVDKHNEFYYDVATGDVTMALATFSEIAVVSDADNPWYGEADTTWYDAEKDYFEIFNANQLAGLAELVDGGINFAGKTVKMCMDVNLLGADDKKMLFNPIGYGYKHQGNQTYFAGTFDGNGNTITGLYQNGWELGYSYSTAGGGLFASIYGATIKNLTMDNAYVVMECIDMGVVVGYAQGNCTFENIIVKNSIIANYNRSTGGVIGEVTNGHHVLKNVDVESTTTISALWGTFDPAIGGLIGGRWSNGTSDMGKNGHPVSVEMDSCDVAAKLDVYNDVTSAYRWYSYRRAGMLIGNTEYSAKDASGRTEATAPFLTTVNCTVSYGDWANYTYCEFGNEYYPFVRVQEGHNGFNGAYSNARYGLPKIKDGINKLDPAKHGVNWQEDHFTDESGNLIEAHHMAIPFNQLYGGGQGCYGGNGHIGEGKVTELNAPEVTTKFEATTNNVVVSGTVTLGELFNAIDESKIVDTGVYASIAFLDEKATVRGTYNTINQSEDWTKNEITFTGTGFVKITINDYYYCEPTVINVFVIDTKADYYIAAKRSSGYYWYMTNDLGTASTKRYQAVNSGLTTLPAVIKGAKADKMFRFEQVSGNTFKIKTGEEYGDYLGRTDTDNSGHLVDENSAITATINLTDKGTINIHYTADEERYLALNSDPTYEYFAWYKGENQLRGLYLIPATPCEHTNKTTTTVDATCTTDGSITVTCDDCGATVSTEAIEALGHDYVDGKCTVCGEPDPDVSTQLTWQLVTDASALKAGNQIVIVAKDYNYALSTTQNNNNRGQASVTKNGNTITFGNDVQVITLEAGTKSNTFAFKVANGYLYAASSSSNHLKTKTTLDDNGSWLITISAEGIATIEAQGTNTRNLLRYNATNKPPIFSAYGRGQTDICLYVKVEGETGGEEPEVPDCQHTNTTTTTVNATCNTAGSTTVTCKDCGEVVNTTEIPATGAHTYESVVTEPTCVAGGYTTHTCSKCGDSYKDSETVATGEHNYVDGKCSVCGAEDPNASTPDVPVETTATLSFANKAQRTSFSTTQQVWEQNGITLTNNKASSTTNVADYASPARCYKGSSISITAPGNITQIVFDCNSSDYATALKNSIGTVSGVTVVVSSDKVTVTFTTAVETFTIAKLTAQVRLDSITVTYAAAK